MLLFLYPDKNPAADHVSGDHVQSAQEMVENKNGNFAKHPKAESKLGGQIAGWIPQLVKLSSKTRVYVRIEV